jgi:glycine/D-amino acid oxidase-like deaminating enzyme
MVSGLQRDVAIVGAGIIGCSTAYFLARQGVSVTVYDPAGIAAGASGRNNGLIEHTYDDASAPLFFETVELMREWLGEAMPTEPVGALLLADDEAAARELLTHYSQFPELEPVLLDPAAARAEEPLLAEGLWGCLLHTGFPISPLEATTSVADRARAAGAEFVLGEPVDLARLRNTGAEVLVAAGASSTHLLDGLVPADAIKALWGVIVLVDLPRRPRHPIIEGTVTRGLTTGKIENQTPFTLLDSPSWLAVGSTLLEGDEPRAGEWMPRLLRDGTRFVPSIEQAKIQSTLVCARPKSFDNRPILGRVPGADHLWLASGHGGRGMSLGASSGRLMAEAIIAGHDSGIAPELSAARLSG